MPLNKVYQENKEIKKVMEKPSISYRGVKIYHLNRLKNKLITSLLAFIVQGCCLL